MGRAARDHRKQYHPDPVEHIELSQKHVGLRIALVAVLMAVGASFLGYGLLQVVRPDSDWITVEASASAGVTCGDEFVFLYRPGGEGRSATADRRGVTTLYTQLCREGYRQFSNWESFEDVGNLYDLNHHPNETLEVGEGLYAALCELERSGSRALYLGPVYDRYEGVFSCREDSQLAEFDPRISPEVAEEYKAYVAYANDPQAVNLELLDGNRVRLAVSQAYLEFARREGVESFVEFSWMRNAFLADFIAEGLSAQGYTQGVLSSCDGFCRNLDGGVDYALTFHSRQDNTVYPAGELTYRGAMTLVTLRDYPVNELDSNWFYTLRTGERRTPYLDPADGLCRNALPELLCCSRNKGCGEVLLAMFPVYVAEEFDPVSLDRLEEQGIDSFYWQGFRLRATGSLAACGRFYDQDGVTFSAAQ